MQKPTFQSHIDLSVGRSQRKYYKSGLSTNKDIRMLADINTFSYEGPDYNPLKVTYGDKDITEEYKACNNVLEQLELIDSLTIKL